MEVKTKIRKCMEQMKCQVVVQIHVVIFDDLRTYLVIGLISLIQAYFPLFFQLPLLSTGM